jgi:hypothetical protein
MQDVLAARGALVGVAQHLHGDEWRHCTAARDL